MQKNLSDVGLAETLTLTNNNTMKKLLLVVAAALPIVVVGVIPALFSSCAVVQDARDQLADMPEEKYQELVMKVRDNSLRLGRLGQEHLDFEIRLKIVSVSQKVMTIVNNDGVTTADVGQWVMEYFDASELPEDALEMIQDGIRFLDAAVGQIRLGIDGKITFREKQLMLTVIAGINAGLVS